MADQETCPDADSLHELLAGSVPDDRQAELARHLEACADCRNRLAEAAGETAMVSEAARESGNQTAAAGAKLQELIDELKAQRPDATAAFEQSTVADDSLGFLEPSDDPEDLGRLGQYGVTEVIGRGGMGVVLKAHDPSLNRFVAIKVLAPELASHGTARKRFLREARAAAAVSHDHVVTIHAVEPAGRLPFLVMEYIDGVSLEDRIKRTGPMKLAEILRIGMQAASGLAAAHAQGLVHRDIKPANILLENGVERVKLTDFGLARAAADAQITQTGVVAGTPQYMSPEQARGEPVDHRSDLFSLGSVLYAMCTGRSPFRATTAIDAIRRVCDDTPRPIQEVNSEIPDWLVAIVDRLLAKEPAERFDSASEVSEALGRHLADRQGPSRAPLARPPVMPPASQGETLRPMRRRVVRAVTAVCVGLGLLGLLELTGVTTLWPRATPSPTQDAGEQSAGSGRPGNHSKGRSKPRDATPPKAPDGYSYVLFGDVANLGLADATDTPGNNLAELPTGGRTFATVPFFVASRYVHLGRSGGSSGLLQVMPNGVKGIRVDGYASKLHLLHGVQMCFPTYETTIAEYKVHYEDGSCESIPVVNGVDVWDWWFVTIRRPATNGHVAWAGSNSYQRNDRQGKNLQITLFRSEWENPHPDKRISTIEFRKAGDVPAAPFCVAITCEQPGVRTGS